MKTIALTLFAAALGLAQSQSSAPAAPAPPAKAAAQTPSNASSKKPPQPSKPSPEQNAKAQSQPPFLPAGAVLVEQYLYRYKDSAGKTWMYRQTPFGFSRWEEGSLPAPPAAAQSEPVVVTDLGDSVRFQRKTPFGFGTWVRKKSELNDEEKALLSASNPDGSQVADKTKEDK